MPSENFPPLQLGQVIRVTRSRAIPGKHPMAPDSCEKTITEGTITALARVKDDLNAIRVSYTDGQAEHTSYAWIHIIHGLLLHSHGQTIEILAQPPEQGALFNRRAA